MSSPAAVIGLSFAATDLQQNPFGIFLEIVRGLGEGPSVRGKDTIVPALTGRIARNRKADTWRIELVGWVAGQGATEAIQRSDFADLRAQLLALFDPTNAPAALVATTENGDTWTIQARTLPGKMWDQQVPSMARLSVELEAVADWVVT